MSTAFLLSAGVSIGLQLFGAVLQKPQEIGKLESRKLPDSSYGTKIPKGDALHLVRGVLIASQKELTETKTRKGKIGGKTIEYTYSSTLAFALCQGPISSVLQIKLNGDIVMDFLSSDPGTLAAAKEFRDKITIYYGTKTQPVDSDLLEINTPGVAYRDTAIVVLPDWPLTEKFGNRPPLLEAIVSTTANLANTNVSVPDIKPIVFTGTGTITTPTDSIDVGAVSRVAHTGVGVAVQTCSSGVSNLGDAEFFELFFKTSATLTFGLASTATAPASPANLGVRFDMTGGNLRAYVPSFGPITSVPFTAGALKISRANGLVRASVNGIDMGASMGLTGPVYLHAYLSPGDALSGLVSQATSVAVSKANITPMPLATILQNICAAAGIGADTSEINDLVLGIERKGNTPQDWIKQLQDIYGFFTIDTGSQIKFLNGNRPPAVRRFTDYKQLGEEGGVTYSWEQEELKKLPYECVVSYYDLESGLEKTAYFRLDGGAPGDPEKSKNRINLATGATLTETEAKGLAAFTVARIWMGRETYKIKSSFDNADLEPGDVIELPYLSGFQEFLITKATYGANFSIEFEYIRYDRSPWQLKETPTAPGAALGASSFNVPAKLFLAQLPKIDDTHPAAPIYWAVAKAIPSWQGVSLAVSNDNGGTFVQAGSTFNQAAVGIAISELAAFPGTGIDSTSTLRLRTSEPLDTITEALFTSGNQVNWIVVGDEILKYRNAVLLGTSQYYYYEISRFLRGLLSTPKLVKPIGSRFALVSDLEVLNRAKVGNVAEIIQLKLFLSGANTSVKAPFSYTVS